ncbi:hypothetical protein OJ997_04810 [Solirubrobacter phytolaccae]|uniref:DUF2314 domain-containing protein n=1 Tax=Solirubrobacter phytolaccae TaxID=1404360 RepID=A0A9X3NBD7_9ACTN|nr:hypothetical protein [Solirubrobacter phytolaccae]MDA0179607.1 hypothetical protein [Solirubrobacter phytolaccae]
MTAICSVCGEEHPLADMVTAHIEPEDVPADARAATPEPHDWWLADGEALHAEHPRSFFIPTRERREALQPGELIKLEFQYGPHADSEGEGHVERMWVEVVEAGHGILRNGPFRIQGLELGDHVSFHPEHVISIDYSDAELGYAQDERPIVDEHILREDRAPDVVARAPGPDGGDTWWMLLREDSSQPVEERINFLTDKFPALVEPLRAGEGVWERDGETYRRVDATTGEWPSLLAFLASAAEQLRLSMEQDAPD